MQHDDGRLSRERIARQLVADLHTASVDLSTRGLAHRRDRHMPPVRTSARQREQANRNRFPESHAVNLGCHPERSEGKTLSLAPLGTTLSRYYSSLLRVLHVHVEPGD